MEFVSRIVSHDFFRSVRRTLSVHRDRFVYLVSSPLMASISRIQLVNDKSITNFGIVSHLSTIVAVNYCRQRVAP